MTESRRRDEPFSRAQAAFEAHMARHQAAVERGMAAHHRALEGMERRIAEAMRAHARAIEAMEWRMGGRKAGDSGRKPPDRPRRRDEGGEAAPVKPRPKPTPLSGAAAAPIE